MYLLGQNCLHLPFNHIEAVTHTLVNMSNCQILLSMHVKYYRKNEFVENVWPAKSALFIYILTHCVEAVKQLDCSRYSQLTRWCKGILICFGCELSRVQFPAPTRVFIFVLLLLCFYFFVQKHIICHIIKQFLFAMLKYLVCLTYYTICD